MRLLEKDVFFFTTFGGEALSLAAARATLTEIVKRDVPGHLAVQGTRLRDGYNRIVAAHEMERYTRCTGPACRTLVTFDPSAGDALELKSLMQQELLRHGVLWSGTNTLSAAHGPHDVQHLLAAYAEALGVLRHAVERDEVRELLRGDPVEPVFRRTGNFNMRPRVRA